VEQSAEYKALDEKDTKTPAAQLKLKKDAYEAWMAYLLIKGSDQSKYGSLTKGFVSQFSLGNDQYPKTIQMATDVLSNHRLDPKFFENQKKSRERQNEPKGPPAEVDAPGATSFAQGKKDVICFICGKPGHTKPECPDADKIPRAKWAVNKAIGAMRRLHQIGDNDVEQECMQQERRRHEKRKRLERLPVLYSNRDRNNSAQARKACV
jgi:hypothetical protein